MSSVSRPLFLLKGDIDLADRLVGYLPANGSTEAADDGGGVYSRPALAPLTTITKPSGSKTRRAAEDRCRQQPVARKISSSRRTGHARCCPAGREQVRG